MDKDRLASPAWDVASILLLLLAAWKLHGAGAVHRYSYYTELRDTVSLAWLAAGFRFYYYRWLPAVVVSGIIVVLFNPLSPIEMRKWQWQPYDFWTMVASLGASACLAYLTYKVHRKATLSGLEQT